MQIAVNRDNFVPTIKIREWVLPPWIRILWYNENVHSHVVVSVKTLIVGNDINSNNATGTFNKN